MKEQTIECDNDLETVSFRILRNNNSEQSQVLTELFTLVSSTIGNTSMADLWANLTGKDPSVDLFYAKDSIQDMMNNWYHLHRCQKLFCFVS